MNTLRVGVVIARFQPLLPGQVEQILAPAVENSDLVIVLLGSSGRARTCVDPLGDLTRQELVELSLVGNKTPLVFEPIRDFMYADTPVDWIVQVQSKVSHAIRRASHNFGRWFPAGAKSSDVEITLYGAESEGSTKEFHTWFPQWNVHLGSIENVDESYRNYTNLLFEGVTPDYESGAARDRLLAWLNSPEGERLRAEHFYVQDYKERTQVGKFPIQFQTIDNVVYYKGNILLVKRRSQPGKGLWALPGGFLEADETCKQGAVRELQEETRLRVRPEWIVSRDIFDHPRRSVRGRTITNAFLWKIPDSATFPKVRAGSDASRVKWEPLAKVLEEMGDQLFEDHLDIITTLIKRL